MAAIHPDRAPRRAPRLASDSLRGWISVGAAMITLAALRVGTAVGDGTPTQASSVRGFTLTLVVFYLVHLLLTWWAFGRLDPTELRAAIMASTPQGRRARLHRVTAMESTSWVLAAVGTALVVVAYTLLEPATRQDWLALALAGVMVVLAWAVMQISATVLLLRVDVSEASLRFPDAGPQGLPDYRYVATQVLTTSATADVAITTTIGRRAVTTLSIAALVFNTVVVALLVSAFLGLTA